MKFKFLSLFSLLILFGSCSNSETSEITLNFKLEYDGEPLVFFEPVLYPDGREFEFTRFSYYVSDISLINDDESLTIQDVDYLDLTASHSSIEDAQNGLSYKIELDDPFSYDELNFNLGLTSDLNSTTPQDHNSSSALSLTGEYWSSWNSYVFVKIEGRLDLDGDGITDGIALHLGSDNALRNITIQNLDSRDEINVIIDAKQIFENMGNVFDIDTNPRIHSLTQMDQINMLMDNFVESITVRD